MSRYTFVKCAIATMVLLGLSSNVLAHGAWMDGYDSHQSVSNYLPGIYVGIMGGYASTHWSNVEDIDNNWVTDIKVNPDCGAFAWRPFIGYDINQFFAIEAGYTYIHGHDFKINSADGTMVYFDDCISEYAIDANAKLKVPLINSFGVFAKIGVVYLNACDAPKHTEGTDPMGGANPRFKKDDRSSVNAMFAVGASYCFTPNFIADLSWTHYRANADWGNCFIPDVSLFSLGLMYKFCY